MRNEIALITIKGIFLVILWDPELSHLFWPMKQLLAYHKWCMSIFKICEVSLVFVRVVVEHNKYYVILNNNKPSNMIPLFL